MSKGGSISQSVKVGKTRARATMPVYPFALISALVRVVQRLLRPARSAVEVGFGAARDLTRTRSELLAENAFLRQQLIERWPKRARNG